MQAVFDCGRFLPNGERRIRKEYRNWLILKAIGIKKDWPFTTRIK